MEKLLTIADVQKIAKSELPSEVNQEGNRLAKKLANYNQDGLAMGDIIERIDGQLFHDSQQVARYLLTGVKPGGTVTIEIRRGLPHPFASHPRLDLYVGSTSPHPIQKMGCTICHEGQGSSTIFTLSSHTPNTLKARQQWKKDYNYYHNHHWIYPMYPGRFNESSCLKCHHELTELQPSERFPDPPAPKVVQGGHLIEKYGCFGCHEVSGFNGDKRVGPDLRLEPNDYAASLQLSYMLKERLANDTNYQDREKLLQAIKSTYASLAQADRAREPFLQRVKRQQAVVASLQGASQLQTEKNKLARLKKELEPKQKIVDDLTAKLAKERAELTEEKFVRAAELSEFLKLASAHGKEPENQKLRDQIRKWLKKIKGVPKVFFSQEKPNWLLCLRRKKIQGSCVNQVPHFGISPVKWSSGS